MAKWHRSSNNEDILQLNHLKIYLDFFHLSAFMQPDANRPTREKVMQVFTKSSPILTLYPEAHWFRKRCRAHREQASEQKLQCDTPGC